MPAPGIGAEWRVGLAFLAIIFVRAIFGRCGGGGGGCGGGCGGGRWWRVSEDSTSECDVK